MKNIISLIVLIAVVVVLIVVFTGNKDDMQVVEPMPEIEQMATYQARFVGTWSADTHPTDFPTNPHFSPFVIVTHDASADLFESGELASAGIQLMAETGKTNVLVDEINSVETGIYSHEVGSRFDSPGSSDLEIDFRVNEPFFSMVSMIAPSPDWFVGTRNVSMIGEDGDWRDSIRIDLGTYDSGTDNGGTFTSADLVTDPAEEIFMITDGPLAEDGVVESLGYIELTRVQ